MLTLECRENLVVDFAVGGEALVGLEQLDRLMATPNAKPKPKEDPASISAQNQRLTLLQAVTAFKTKIADPRLISQGQFTWAIRYREKLREKVRNVVATHSSLSESWISEEGLMKRFIKAYRERDVAQFNGLMKEALGLPAMRDGSREARTMRQLLQAAGAGGKVAHDRAMRFLRQGRP